MSITISMAVVSSQTVSMAVSGIAQTVSSIVVRVSSGISLGLGLSVSRPLAVVSESMAVSISKTM